MSKFLNGFTLLGIIYPSRLSIIIIKLQKTRTGCPSKLLTEIYDRINMRIWLSQFPQQDSQSSYNLIFDP
jgi:hypothetical protein